MPAGSRIGPSAGAAGSAAWAEPARATAQKSRHAVTNDARGMNSHPFVERAAGRDAFQAGWGEPPVRRKGARQGSAHVLHRPNPGNGKLAARPLEMGDHLIHDTDQIGVESYRIIAMDP